MDAQRKPESARSPLLELSNAMVALHRLHFGRGPAMAKSVLAEGIAFCLMGDIYTPVERRLIEAGRGEHVEMTRMLHQRSCEAEYRAAAEAALGRAVAVVLSAVHIDPDMVVEVFVLGEGTEARREDAAGEGAAGAGQER